MKHQSRVWKCTTRLAFEILLKHTWLRLLSCSAFSHSCALSKMTPSIAIWVDKICSWNKTFTVYGIQNVKITSRLPAVTLHVKYFVFAKTLPNNVGICYSVKVCAFPPFHLPLRKSTGRSCWRKQTCWSPWQHLQADERDKTDSDSDFQKHQVRNGKVNVQSKRVNVSHLFSGVVNRQTQDALGPGHWYEIQLLTEPGILWNSAHVEKVLIIQWMCSTIEHCQMQNNYLCLTSNCDASRKKEGAKDRVRLTVFFPIFKCRSAEVDCLFYMWNGSAMRDRPDPLGLYKHSPFPQHTLQLI